MSNGARNFADSDLFIYVIDRVTSSQPPWLGFYWLLINEAPIQEALGPFMRMAEKSSSGAPSSTISHVHEDNAVGHFMAHFVCDHDHECMPIFG